MKIKQLWKCLVVLLFLPLMSARCSSVTYEPEGEGGTVVFWPAPGVRFSFPLPWKWIRPGPGLVNGGLRITNDTGEPRTGCVVFLNDQMEEIGRSKRGTLKPGQTRIIPAPPGTAGWYIDDDCDGDQTAIAQGGGGAAAAPITPWLNRPYSSQKVVLRMDSTPGAHNPEYILSGNGSRADFVTAKQWIRMGGYWNPLPPSSLGLQVVHYTDVQTLPNSNDFLVTVANDVPFQSLELWINGALFATLADGVPPAQLGAGWSAVSFLVPAGALNFSPVPGDTWRNEFEFRFSTVEGSFQIGRITENTTL